MPKWIIYFLFLIIVFSGCTSPNNQYSILFDRVDGLKEKSVVLNNGITIGTVSHMDLFNNKVLVDIKLTKGIKIPGESKFYVKENLLGSSFIDVEFSDKKVFISSQDTVTGRYVQKAILDDLVSDTAKKKEWNNR